MTSDYKAQMLLVRVKRLQYFAQAFQGKRNPLIEHAAYLVLQTYESAPKAIWRYIRYAVKLWWLVECARLKYDSLYWMYRLRGHASTEALDKIDAWMDQKYK